MSQNIMTTIVIQNIMHPIETVPKLVCVLLLTSHSKYQKPGRSYDLHSPKHFQLLLMQNYAFWLAFNKRSYLAFNISSDTFFISLLHLLTTWSILVSVFSIIYIMSRFYQFLISLFFCLYRIRQKTAPKLNCS